MRGVHAHVQEKKYNEVYQQYKQDVLQGGHASKMPGSGAAGGKLGWFAAWLDRLDDTVVCLVHNAIAMAPYFIMIGFIHISK